MADKFVGGCEAMKRIKAALGITCLCEKIVIELDGNRIPKVYIKAIGMKHLVDTAVGLFALEPVADVTVNERGEVEKVPHPEGSR